MGIADFNSKYLMTLLEKVNKKIKKKKIDG